MEHPAQQKERGGGEEEEQEENYDEEESRENQKKFRSALNKRYRYLLSEKGMTYLEKNDFDIEDTDEKNLSSVFPFLLDQDIRYYGDKTLPDFSKMDQMPQGNSFLVQIKTTKNISEPDDRQVSLFLFPFFLIFPSFSEPLKQKGTTAAAAGPLRMLCLTVTDGRTTARAVEASPIPSLKMTTPPGTKLLLTNAQIDKGLLLLRKENVQVLGGRVEVLVASWEASRFKRPKHAKDEERPPPFTPLSLQQKERQNKGRGSNDKKGEGSEKLGESQSSKKVDPPKPSTQPQRQSQQSRPQSQPKTQPKSQPKTQPQSQTQPQRQQSRPQSQPKTQPQSQPKTQPQSQTQPQRQQSRSQSQPKTQPQSQTQPPTQRQPESQSQSQPQQQKQKQRQKQKQNSQPQSRQTPNRQEKKETQNEERSKRNYQSRNAHPKKSFTTPPSSVPSSEVPHSPSSSLSSSPFPVSESGPSPISASKNQDTLKPEMVSQYSLQMAEDFVPPSTSSYLPDQDRNQPHSQGVYQPQHPPYPLHQQPYQHSQQPVYYRSSPTHSPHPPRQHYESRSYQHRNYHRHHAQQQQSQTQQGSVTASQPPSQPEQESQPQQSQQQLSQPKQEKRVKAELYVPAGRREGNKRAGEAKEKEKEKEKTPDQEKVEAAEKPSGEKDSKGGEKKNQDNRGRQKGEKEANKMAGGKDWKPVKGERCQAQWKDGKWYPGIVIKPSDSDRFLVQFIGYGDTMSLPFKRLRPT